MGDIGGLITSFLPLACRSRLLNQESSPGYTPLMEEYCHRALALGRVKLLVEAGADPDIMSKHGETVLDLARLCHSNDIVPYLEQLTGASRSDFASDEAVVGSEDADSIAREGM